MRGRPLPRRAPPKPEARPAPHARVRTAVAAHGGLWPAVCVSAVLTSGSDSGTQRRGSIFPIVKRAFVKTYFRSEPQSHFALSRAAVSSACAHRKPSRAGWGRSLLPRRLAAVAPPHAHTAQPRLEAVRPDASAWADTVRCSMRRRNSYLFSWCHSAASGRSHAGPCTPLSPTRGTAIGTCHLKCRRACLRVLL